MPNSRILVEKLNRVRADLLAVAESVPAEKWQKRPAHGGWSVAEVIAHLTMVETAITEGASKLVTREPKPVALWKRLHWPVKLAQWRFPKARTPVPLDPRLVGEKEAMLERFHAGRERTLGFLASNCDRDLGRWRWPHPFFGNLNGYTWFKLMYLHEIRHTKQMRAIVNSL